MSAYSSIGSGVDSGVGVGVGSGVGVGNGFEDGGGISIPLIYPPYFLSPIFISILSIPSFTSTRATY
mgnify:CR=1 FL=1